MQEKFSVPGSLRAAAEIFEERSKSYGDNYKKFGSVMKDLFPNGLKLEGENDWNRFGIFVQVVSKLTRYAENFERGGHEDSLADLSVYCHMLIELDQESRRENEKNICV